MTCQTCHGLTYLRHCDTDGALCPSDCRDHLTTCPECVPDPFEGVYGAEEPRARHQGSIPLEAWINHHPAARTTRKAPPMPNRQPSPGLDRIRRAELDDLVTRFRTYRNAAAPIILTAREVELVADMFDSLAEAS